MKTYIALRRIEKGNGEYAERGDEIQLPDDLAGILLAKGRVRPRPRQKRTYPEVVEAAPEEQQEELEHGTDN